MSISVIIELWQPYPGENEDAACQSVNSVNVSNVAVPELFHERESHTVQPGVPLGTDNVGGGFVHDHEVLVLVDYFDRLVQDGRLVNVKDPGKVVALPQHNFSRIPDMIFNAKNSGGLGK